MARALDVLEHAGKRMRIGYLMNIYPVTSGTFIRREIRAIEDHGIEIKRYAIRRWSEELVEQQDREEQIKTHYILSGRFKALIFNTLLEVLQNPVGTSHALSAWWRLLRNSKNGFIRHVAYFMEACSLKRRMKLDGISHLHAHFSSNTTAVALLAHRLGGPSFSFTAHGPDEFVDWSESSLKFKVKEADFVVAISKYCRAQLILASGYEHQDKIHIVRCGVKLSELEISPVPFDEGSPFVCVGRLCPQKAQLLIVEAVAKVVTVYPNIRVLLIGDGESRLEVEEAIKWRDLQDNVVLMGWRNSSEVREILGTARALLLPSLAEGLPIVIMEAMALGRPVISTFVAGIPELVDHTNGWLIPSGSVDDISNAMTDALALSPEELIHMGRLGYERVLALHDVDRNALDIAALIDGTL